MEGFNRPRVDSDWSLLSFDNDNIEVIATTELGMDMGVDCIKEIVLDNGEFDLTQFNPLEAMDVIHSQEDEEYTEVTMSPE